jgi:dTDP-4-dehydrorhamnose 3,5-epimerase
MVLPLDSGLIRMKFIETAIAGVYIIELECFHDERGFFAEAFQIEKFRIMGLETEVAQTNVSYNINKGVIRGLHFQRPPKAQAKLIRCTKGSIFDVAVDLRKGSPTYRKWVGEMLSEENRTMLFIPAEGMAHGYQALEDQTEVEYIAFEIWAPETEGGYRYDDPAFGIEWPLKEVILSEKDGEWAPLEE